MYTIPPYRKSRTLKIEKKISLKRREKNNDVFLILIKIYVSVLKLMKNTSQVKRISKVVI